MLEVRMETGVLQEPKAAIYSGKALSSPNNSNDLGRGPRAPREMADTVVIALGETLSGGPS